MAWAVAILASAHAALAAAQADTPTATVEIASEERRRGIGWSGGDPVLSVSATAGLTPGLSLTATATSLGGRNRHGNADGVADIDLRWSRQVSGWRVSAQGRYHIFAGTQRLDYGEVGAQASTIIGPASIDFGALYAPPQHGIGGDNLYIFTAASIGIPNTPLTLSGHVGHSSGNINDAFRATRLRPTGAYRDHGVALDWYRGKWFLGVHYTGTNIGRTANGNTNATGDRIIARAGFSF